MIVRAARERRKERGLTQQHLAALANVGRSTLNRFENQSGDVTLSSVLRILGVLDMLDRKQEGTLRLKGIGGKRRLLPASNHWRHSFQILLYQRKHRSGQSVRLVAGEVDPFPVCR
jgi:transcriptional regulator with XRE-family HTH domain